MKWGLRITVTGKYDHGPCIRLTPEFTLFLRAVLLFLPQISVPRDHACLLI